MRNTTMHAIRFGRIAIAGAAACFAVSASAVTVPGGTITFLGALVAPPFALSTNARTSADGPGFSARGDQSGNTASVTFTPEPNSAPSADVSLSVDNHRATPGELNASFADGKGRRIAPNSGGVFHVGASGGVLSMQGKDASTKLVTLVTNYQ